MTKEEIERIKQMMVSENTNDNNLVGPMLRQLFKDEKSFNQFVQLMNEPSLYPMKSMLASNIVEPYKDYNGQQFTVRLNNNWFKLNDIIVLQGKPCRVENGFEYTAQHLTNTFGE